MKLSLTHELTGITISLLVLIGLIYSTWRMP